MPCGLTGFCRSFCKKFAAVLRDLFRASVSRICSSLALNSVFGDHFTLSVIVPVILFSLTFFFFIALSVFSLLIKHINLTGNKI